jgi:hypothetical protein
MLSADSQVAAMRRDWPGFRLTGQAGGRLTWKGPLRPLGLEYTLQIVLQTKNRKWPKGRKPRVTVISPKLIPRSSAPQEAVPHTYKNDEDLTSPLLCLYDPDDLEWTHDRQVAETIVPWIIDWLVCYEIWHATGRWVGGGRHPTLPATTPEKIGSAQA